MRTTKNWETLYIDIVCRYNNKTQAIKLQGNAKGNWHSRDKSIDKLQGCIEVDIPLTHLQIPYPLTGCNWEMMKNSKSR
ncbi:putative glycolipid-binding domain-containing protein [Pedobacter sp. CCM 8938]|uniref:Glycolipid-binding domain-containing protein n=1 Tax=Pedobacter fastidiosus TaxID=2765361 RepID=A0ABR7KYA4_9SPHI|nr:putative glycolipid-binding domain-containing protein [Pedobacter fastidiosus]